MVRSQFLASHLPHFSVQEGKKQLQLFSTMVCTLTLLLKAYPNILQRLNSKYPPLSKLRNQHKLRCEQDFFTMKTIGMSSFAVVEFHSK